MYSRPKLSLYSWSVSPMSSHVLNFPLTRVFITRLKAITAINLKAMSYCSIYSGHFSLGMSSHHISSILRGGFMSEICLTTSLVLNFNPWLPGCLLPRASNILFSQHLSDPVPMDLKTNWLKLQIYSQGMPLVADNWNEIFRILIGQDLWERALIGWHRMQTCRVCGSAVCHGGGLRGCPLRLMLHKKGTK